MIFFNIRSVQSLDIGWHLASGRYMIETRSIPHQDVFSYTCLGHPWINTYWLQDILLAGFYGAFGVTGLILFKAIVVALIVLLAGFIFLSEERSEYPLLAAVWIFYGAHPLGYGWSEQASLATLLLLTFWLGLLKRFAFNPSRMPLGLTLAIFCLWSNCHRGVLLGLVLTLGCALVSVIQERSVRSLWTVGVAFVGSCLNPWGWAIYRMMAEDVRFSSTHILGWASTPWGHLEIFWITGALFIVTWILLIMRRASDDRFLFVRLFLISGVLTWNAVHFVAQVPYFMIWAVPFIMGYRHIFRIPSTPDTSRRIRQWALAGAIALLFIHRPAWSINGRIFPVKACDFIDRERLPSPFYQEYRFGGYWMWRYGLTRPVFIDGRTPAVSGYAGLFEKTQAAMSGSPEMWQALLDHFNIQGILIGPPYSPTLEFPLELYFPRARWVLVYQDAVGLVFVRRQAMSGEWVSTHELRDVHVRSSSDGRQ
jgi:hypothetical protein